MKKLTFVFLLFLGTISGIAEELTATQKLHRSEIVNFLKEEGFMPEVDNDGDVKFKREGSVYYIRVSSNDESPYFLTLFSAFKYPESYSKRVIKIAANELNFYKGVKLSCYKQEIRVKAEMYYYDVEEFKYVFYKLIKQIKNVEDDFLDECAKVTGASADAGNTVTSSSTTTWGTLLVDEDFSSTSYAWQKSQSDGRVFFRNDLLCSTRLDENMDMTEIGFLIPNKHQIEVDYLKIGLL